MGNVSMKGLGITISLILFSLFLISCGGGSGGLPDSEQPAPILSSVVSVVPADLNENTARDIKIIVTFEKPIQEASVILGETFKVTNNQGDPIDGIFEVNLNEIIFSATPLYSLSSTYKIELSKLKSDDGLLINDFKSSFSTVRGKWFVRQQELGLLLLEHRNSKLVDINPVTGKVVFLFIDSPAQASRPVPEYMAFPREYTSKNGWMNSQSFILPLQNNRRLRGPIFKMFGDESRLMYAGTKSATTSQTTSFTSLNWAKPEFVRDSSYFLGLETAPNGNAIELFIGDNGYNVSLFKGSWLAPVSLNSQFPVRNNDFPIRPFIYDDGTMGVFYSTANSNGGSDIFEHLEPFLGDPVNVTTNNEGLATHSGELENNTLRYDIYGADVLLGYKNMDGTYWTVTKFGGVWEQPQQLDIPPTAAVYKLMKFKDNEKMIVYKDSGLIYSKYFVTNWKPSILVSNTPVLTSAGAMSDIRVIENNGIVTVAWFTETDIRAVQYTDSWQLEQIIESFTDKTKYSTAVPLRLLGANNGVVHAFWGRETIDSIYYSIYTAVLQ